MADGAGERNRMSAVGVPLIIQGRSSDRRGGVADVCLD